MKKKLLMVALLGAATLCVSAQDVQPGAAAVAASQASTAKAWSPYQPVKAPQVPVVKQKAWVRTPVDAFVLAKLEAAGLKPSPEAGRAAYLRRATLDAWGLLPTPEEVAAFVNDKSPHAYEIVVDRLLASPHFGERQARRWLDLARYADSTGFQNDNNRPNNWRYRDYVIDAFNQDKPFDRFVKEQLAGDELWPDNQEARIATGYLAGYPDNANSRDLLQRKYQIETDMTDLVGETLLGATIGCARCHNHKQDKVSQKEYFQLQAFFSNTAFNETYKLKEKTGTDTDWEKAQAAYRAATKPIRDQEEALLAGLDEQAIKYQKERYLTDSQASLFKPESEWTALDRWVNWRHKSVESPRASKVAYLKLSAEDKSSPTYDPVNVEKWKKYEELQKQLKEFDKLKPSDVTSVNLTTAFELGKDAPPTFVRFGGTHEKPTDEVQPAIPSLWNAANQQIQIAPTDRSSGRRTALANWIASPDNPLTARVYVNRVWSQYFDKGTFERRSVPYPLTVSFDPADTAQPHQKRDVTTTPLQALTLFNSDVVFGWSQALAGRVINEAGKDDSARLDRLYEVLLSRKPTKEEKSALQAFLTQQERIVSGKVADASKTGIYAVAVPIGLKRDVPIDPVRAAAFVDLVHTVANSNEFAYRF